MQKSIAENEQFQGFFRVNLKQCLDTTFSECMKIALANTKGKLGSDFLMPVCVEPLSAGAPLRAFS